MENIATFLTFENLARFASWEPVTAGYDRDEATIEKHIRPVLDRIGASEFKLGSSLSKFAYLVFEEGGLTNYFAFFAYDPKQPSVVNEEYQRQSGIIVYLSLLAPIAIFGRAERFFGHRATRLSCIELGNIIDPRQPGSELADHVAEAIAGSDYRLLTPEEATMRLPAGIEPYEYCICREPWDCLSRNLCQYRLNIFVTSAIASRLHIDDHVRMPLSKRFVDLLTAKR